MPRLSRWLFIAWLSGVGLASARQTHDAPVSDVRLKTDVLVVVAHPDDETAIGAHLAQMVFDQGKRISVVYANRGSGGGNSAGTEQAGALGLIRELEVRQALSSFGIDAAWFLSGRDTPGQDVFRSLQEWGHGQVLEELIRIVRLTRPEVILTWLPGYVAGENHGDHQAAGVLAAEAFDAAGDPTVFPAQVAAPREPEDIANATEGLVPWQSKKLYFFSDASHPVRGHGPAFDGNAVSPTKNKTYFELAALLHQPHRTQGEVSEVALQAAKTKDYTEFTQWLGRFRLLFGKSVVKCDPGEEVFQGIDEVAAPFQRQGGYQPERIPEGVSLELGGPFSFYRRFWRAHGIEHLSDVVDPEMEVASGSYVHIPILITNGNTVEREVPVRLVLPPGWKESSGSGTYVVPARSVRPVQLFAFAADSAGEDFHTITIHLDSGKTATAPVTLRVRVRDWTLPQ